MDLAQSDWTRPLRAAETHFLQVLLPRFRLQRKGKGVELRVNFGKDSHAIWARHAKYELQKMMPEFDRKSAMLQASLDRFLLDQTGDAFTHDDDQFVFRYASGGALPVVRIGSSEYYCLFYRDIPPVGWNIANGGSDNWYELQNPLETVERELREELIVVAPEADEPKRYVFAEDEGKPLDRPEFAEARRYWDKRFRKLGLPLFADMEEIRVPLNWLDGPDQLTLNPGAPRPAGCHGIFLNINAEDFGIEVDRVARLEFDEDAIFLDGEITEGQLVDRPVGLFDVDAFNKVLLEEHREFSPDLFFFDAVRYDEKDLRRVIQEKFLPQIAGARSEQEAAAYDHEENPFDLCPVTRRILHRYLASQEEPPEIGRGPFDVFISFGGEDVSVASQVYEHLARRKVKAFFSKRTVEHPDFMRAIGDALDSAHCFVAVASHPDNLKRSYPDYEMRSFFNDILNGRKPETAKLASFIGGFHPADLPRPLRLYQCIDYGEKGIARALNDLSTFVP